jgi:hypothetical protein
MVPESRIIRVLLESDTGPREAEGKIRFDDLGTRVSAE